MTDKEYRKRLENLQESRGWALAAGLVLILVGTAAAAIPFLIGFAIETVVGWLFITAGAVFVAYHMFRSEKWTRFLLELLLGIFYAGFGVLILVSPIRGVFALSLALSIFLAAEGVVKIFQSLRMRPAPNWRWILASGVISIFLALALLSATPRYGFWAVGLIVGSDLVVSGLSILMVALAFRGRTGEEQVHCIGEECYSER